MSLSVNYIYEYALKLIRKNQSSGLTSIEFAYHWNAAQGGYQDDLLGRFQARNNGKEGANTGLIENETILTKLTPFTKAASLTIASGQSAKPAGFIYTLALRINNAKVFNVDKDEIAAMLDDVIDPASESTDTYYYTEYEDYYKFFPATVVAADLDYISTPTDIFWNYTFDGNNRQVYSSGGSIQPVWDNNSCREITERMLKALGVSFKDQDFEQFGQSVINAGE